MLADLRHPAVFVVVVLSFIVGLAARGAVQHAMIRMARPRWARREPLRLAALFDPYGAAAAVVGGIGWGSPLVPVWFGRRGNGRAAVALLSGPATNIALGVGALEAFRAVFPQDVSLIRVDSWWFLGGAVDFGFDVHFWRLALLTFGLVNLALGILHLLPVPPLDLGRLLMAMAPATPGWQKLAYHTLEESWGVLAILVLGVLPGPPSFLVQIVSAICSPIQSLIAG